MSDRDDQGRIPWRALITTLIIWLVLTWGNRNDLLFPFGAREIEGEVLSWKVEAEHWGTSGSLNAPPRTGVDIVPSLEVRLSDPKRSHCTVTDVRYVFGLRKPESLQAMRNALERLHAAKKHVIFIREIDGGLDCRLSKALSPRFMILWSSFLLMVILLSVLKWRRGRRATDDQQETK